MITFIIDLARTYPEVLPNEKKIVRCSILAPNVGPLAPNVRPLAPNVGPLAPNVGRKRYYEKHPKGVLPFLDRYTILFQHL